MHVPDGFRPPGFSVPEVDANGKGVIEMRNSGDVPSVTGRGACAETVRVVDKIGDDQLNDLHRKSVCRGRVRRRGLRRNTP